MVRVVMVLATLFVLPSLGRAAGPDAVALTDRVHCPSPENFDLASRAEILVFTEAFAATEQLDAAAVKGLLGVHAVDMPSVERWRDRTRAALVRNFQAASQQCAAADDTFPACHAGELDALSVANWPELLRFATAFSGPAGDAGMLPTGWLADARRFHAAYVREQLRLAALFGRVTSEVLPLAPDELLGGEMEDGSFLLTFDDGPSAPDRSTDAITALLRAHGQNALFFVLGESLRARLSRSPLGRIRALYADMCVGSHGAEHRSHATWPQAFQELERFSGKLSGVLPTGQDSVRFFRPPYGQRTGNLVRSLAGKGLRTMLWNIDSQDWRKEVTPELAAGRVMTLMLLWRRGIILFHDVHTKPEKALPLLWRMLEGSRVRWVDCRQARL